MIARVSKNEFVDLFEKIGRGAQFSRESLWAIYDFLEEIDPNTEIDPIEVCCNYTEYSSGLEAAFDFGGDFDREQEDEALEWLKYRTIVLDTKNGLVVRNFVA